MIEIWLAFLAGLAGSFHCIGMCGGIVAALAMTGAGQSFGSRLQFQLCYNLGRVSTYTLLGALAGLIGSSLDLMALRSVSSWFFIGANLFVIAVGLSSALGLNALNLSSLEGRGARFFAAPVRRAISSKSALAFFPLGLALGFLPCGLVYAPLMVAAASGGPGLGAATMAALGLGTFPVLLLLGTASSAISGALRSAMLRAAGLAVALMGAAGLWRALARSCCSG
ncbi:MAG TPA: sulfite exporter TauE/SafE family protein [Geomonas sp.]